MNAEFPLLNGRTLALYPDDRTRIVDATLVHEGSLLAFFDAPANDEKIAAIKWSAETAREYLKAFDAKRRVFERRVALAEAIRAASELAANVPAPYCRAELDRLRREVESDDTWQSMSDAEELRRRFNPYSS